jgi:type II restriction enzyme
LLSTRCFQSALNGNCTFSTLSYCAIIDTTLDNTLGEEKPVLPEPKYVKSPKDLVTPIDITQSGFLQQALRKTKEASPYVDQAKQLLNKLQVAHTPKELLGFPEIRADLITAAGFSDKSTNYFSSSELEKALLRILMEIEERAGLDWRVEITYRFLLTRGDTLGGVMRNIMGAEAKAKLTEAILAALRDKGITPIVTCSKVDAEKVQQVSWPERLLLFDKKPKIIGKNVDAILLRQTSERSLPVTALLNSKENYLACGEVKGGIDPAGADEHWKTAYGALDRIREKLKEKPPKLFFIGAAIENSMAEEIFSQLQSGLLSHAANLLVPQQLSDLASWLVSL